MLHARYEVENGAQNIVVDSPDTDVCVLLVHHFSAIGCASIFFHTGCTCVHTDPSRYVPVHDIHSELTQSQLNVLLPVYCITGCDTCSFIRGKGKATAFRIMSNDSEQHVGLAEFGASPTITKGISKSCVKLMGSLYGKKECKSLNSLRCEKAGRNAKPKNLPPTDDSFQQHVKRCCYQLLIWRMALTANQELPDFTDFGYRFDTDGRLEHVLSTQSHAAPELLNDIICSCETVCGSECIYYISEQPCTSSCKCNGNDGDTENGICVTVKSSNQ